MLACRDADGRWIRQRVMRQAPSLIENGDAAVEAFVDVHRRFGIAAPAGSEEELQATRAEGHGVVIADDALVLEAEDRLRIQPRGPRPIRGRRARRRLRKARIVAREEVCEEGVRLLAVGDVG
jgi:hypothetical protein